MRLAGLNKFVNASTHSRQLQGALISVAPLSVLRRASSLSVRHSNVSHCIWCIVVAASPLTKCARCLTAFRSSCIRTRGFESHGGHQYERLVTNMKGWSLIGKVKSHSEDRRRSAEVGYGRWHSSRCWRRSGRSRRGAGVEAEVPCRSSSQPTRLSSSLS